LDAEILDLSTEGARLAVRSTPAALAATGTVATLALALESGGQELVFGVAIRNVLARPGGCVVGVAFDAPCDAATSEASAQVAAWVERERREQAASAASPSVALQTAISAA
jgi:hypothetical protein